ncbi:MAG: 30S ribosomal protein S19 [Patescibacteria group bacterium]|nr:30S ribosomal protein S19 [Patescibacteria group bacterium]
MSRSLKKGAFVPDKLMKKIEKANDTNDRKPIKTWYRSATIVPEMVGLTFAVHNGRKFLDVFVDENKVGHKLGEFAPTRKFQKHGGRMQKEQEMAASEAEKAKVQAAQSDATK